MFYIYLIRRNGKPVYVGFTSRTLEERWKEHCFASKGISECILHRAIRKYGIDNFTIENIYTGVDWKHTLIVMEPHFIAEYKTFANDHHGGYNMTFGGEGNIGGKRSDETRKKLSEANKGKKMSITARIKMSEGRKGKKHSLASRKKVSEARKGKHHTEETKRKISETKMGGKHSEEAKQKMSEAAKTRKS